jgi:stage IV sporulation protein FB
VKIGGGYVQTEIRGFIPVWIHWTLFALAIIVGRFEFRPGAWLGVLAVILIHELGHAIAVNRARATPTMIYLDGAGGRCEWYGEVSGGWQLAIASGGVIAQLVLWGIAFSVDRLANPPASLFSAHFLDVLLGWNLILVALNLIPVSPFDGQTIWRLLPAILRNWRRRRRMLRRQRLTAVTVKRMKELDRLEPEIKPSQEAREAIRKAIEHAAANFKAQEQNTDLSDEKNRRGD